MAYAAVLSLKLTLQRLIESSEIRIPPLSPQIIQLVYEIVKLFQVSEEISFFTDTVKKIIEQLGNASLPEEEEEDDVVVSSRIDQYFGLKKPKIIGLTDELFEIRLYITDYPYEDPERLIVVAVEGMAGIGKTALVTAVYLDPRIVSHFECRALVSIGPTKPQLRRILLCIIAQINPGFDTSGNAGISDHDEELTSYLHSCLKNRTYLIVVDDVWNTRVWDELIKAFPDDRNKSRVILTTRLFNIAQHASSTMFWHKKQFLNEEESWHLLREKVFGGEKNCCPSQLEEAGRKIAEKCQGLPLMIITLAKHLSQAEKTAEYWEKVAKKEHSHIIAADEEFFKLIKLWCAEEFLESNMTRRLEFVATISLDELVHANVVMVCEQRFSIFAITKTCKLHPALLHLCMREAGNNNFFHVIGSSVNQGIENQRRLCIHNNGLFGIKDVRELMASVANMRSLLCSGPHHPYPVPICLGCFSFLRVLDAHHPLLWFPIEVIKLVKLRYLAFTYNGELPASISKLQNLQYLIVHQYLSIISSGAHRWYLPMEIWNMQELRHLEVMGSDLPEPSYDTDYLWNLLTLYGISTRSCTKESARCHLCSASCSNFPIKYYKVKFERIWISLEQMSTIAHLPELEVLKLRCNAFQGQEWTTYEGEFPQLRFLLLEGIDLRYWTAHHPHSFPLLSRLFIRHCYKLERIPPKYGDKEHLRIDLIDCNPGLVAFAKEEILKKDELENESRLIVINIESSADDRRQFMSNYEAKLNSDDIQQKTERVGIHF
ncbi:UNVERIFIED_CONTAM: putative late blight resistance proteinR1C-3 [Sesamum radiatum]|uniref:Late blight resistance proteinR1C-3 n=1 Tax=Sesamum radiatum TaxID=300843 RepID=A0AAW2RY11_SESRA